MTPEGKVKEEVKSYLRSLGDDCWWFMPMSMGYGRRGIPDFVGIYLGQGFTVETKTQYSKGLSPWQGQERVAINAAGGIAITAKTVDQVKLELERIRDGRA